MLALALRSLRFRTATFAATFLALFLGATLVMAFASMLDTAGGANVDADSEATLHNMATIVGGWGVIIVAFAVASTLTLAVRQRSSEIALLKNIGATPAQLARMIVGEATVVSVLAALAAIVPSMLLGRLLLELLQDTDQVAPAVTYRFGPIAIAIGLIVTLSASTVAAVITTRRATRMRAAESVADAVTDDPRMSKKRVAAAWISLAIALDLAVVTTVVMPADEAMATAGQGSIFAAIGFALLGPRLMRAVADRVAGPLEETAGSSGYLAALSLRQRSGQMASVLMPIILFVGIAVGTLQMQHIETATLTAAGVAKTNEQRNIETLNLAVVGIIATFAAVMLLNTIAAATSHRRREFGQQRLAGATRPQTLSMVGLETSMVVLTGVLFGSIAAIFTIIPYNVARTSEAVPNGSLPIYLGVVAAAALLALTGSLAAARRALAIPAIRAAGVQQ